MVTAPAREYNRAPRSCRAGRITGNPTVRNCDPTRRAGPRALLVDAARARELAAESPDLPSITLGQRQLCDLELLLNGGFAPLDGFLDEAACESVLERLRLPDGTLWPMPVTLDVDRPTAEALDPGARVALRDDEGFMLAVLQVRARWKADKEREARCVYGTASARHPGVRYLRERSGSHYLGGEIEGIRLPVHYDHEEYRHTPQELRRLFAKLGWRRVVAFHTRRPMHRLERELTMQAARSAEGHVLIHPVAGVARAREPAWFARVKCYQAIMQYYPPGLSALSLLPLATREAGPREALWHAVIRGNYGCTHLVVGCDHASPSGPAAGGERFYPPYAAQELIEQHQEELRVRMVPFRRHAYAPARRRFVEAGPEEGRDEDPGPSEPELVRRLVRGEGVPAWFSYPEVLKALRRVHPPRHLQGIVLFFTGLSGSGKSTLARILYGRFVEDGRRPVTLLDGDVVRRQLSSELGFSRAHRDLNVRRIGFVASEIAKNAGVAICAPIAPYASTRQAVREMIEAHGAMIEIHVATPLEVCEARDPKGLYAKARRGLVREFTGISDPYEAPEGPEIRIDTSDLTPTQAAEDIYLYLLREGYLDLPEPPREGPGAEIDPAAFDDAGT